LCQPEGRRQRAESEIDARINASTGTASDRAGHRVKCGGITPHSSRTGTLTGLSNPATGTSLTGWVGGTLITARVTARISPRPNVFEGIRSGEE